MVSKEWTTIVTTKVIDDDGTIRLTVENHDSKATVLISVADAAKIISDLTDCITEAALTGEIK